MGRDFELQCKSSPCERGERRKENLVERASDCSAVFRKSWPDGWEVLEHMPHRSPMLGRDVLALVYPLCSVTDWEHPEKQSSIWKNAEIYPKGVSAGDFQQITLLLLSSLLKGNLSGILMVATTTLSRKWVPDFLFINQEKMNEFTLYYLECKLTLLD